MSEHIIQSPETVAETRIRENQRLLSIIDSGVDRDEVKSAYDAFRAQKPKDAPVGEGQFDNILVYQDFASPEAIRAHDQLVANNVGLAYSVVNRIHQKYDRLDIDDLTQEAWVTLSLAAWQYNSSINMGFPGYVNRVVFNKLDRLRSQSDFALRLQPRHIQMVNRTRALGMDLVKTSVEDIDSVEELFGYKDAQFVMRIESSFRHVLSLDEIYDKNEPQTNAYQEMEEEVIWAVMSEPAVELLLSKLPERERRIVEMRFGIFDGEPYTLEQVASAAGVTKERIRQIEARSLAILRHSGNQEGEQTGIYGLPVKRRAESTVPGNTVATSFEDQKAQRIAQEEERKNRSFALIRARQEILHAWGVFEEEHSGPMNLMVLKAARVLLVDDVTKKPIWNKTDWTFTEGIEASGLPDIRHQSVEEYLSQCVNRMKQQFGKLPREILFSWGRVAGEQKTHLVKTFIEQEIAEKSDLRQQALRDCVTPYEPLNATDDKVADEQLATTEESEMSGAESSKCREDYPSFHKYLIEQYGDSSDMAALISEAVTFVSSDFEEYDLEDEAVRARWEDAIEWYIAERV